MPPDSGDTAILRSMLRKGPSFRRLGCRGSLTGDASSSSRNLGSIPSDSGHNKLASKSHHCERSAADAMRMDALTGLQMPTPGRSDDYAIRGASSSTEIPSADRLRAPPLRSRSSDGMPSGMFTKRTLPRRTPSRSHSSNLQDMAQSALERQSLPDERQNSLLVMRQAVRQHAPPRDDSSQEYMSQKRHGDEAHRQSTVGRDFSTSSRGESIDRERSSQNSRAYYHEPTYRRAPIRTKSTPIISPLEGDQASRPGRRRGDASRSTANQVFHSSIPPPPPPTPSPTRSPPSRTTTTTTTSNYNCAYSPLTIEISSGVFARLRGAQETYHAVENDMYMPTVCHDCQADLCCIMDASYLLCPKCKSISPVEGGNPNINEGGVGLGFTLDDLRTWQTEILAGRSMGYQPSLPSNEPRRSRRQSM